MLFTPIFIAFKKHSFTLKNNQTHKTASPKQSILCIKTALQGDYYLSINLNTTLNYYVILITYQNNQYHGIAP